MADETSNGQVPEENEGGQAPPEPKVFDEEYVKSLRAEAAKYRKEAQAAAAKVATFETERMTEAERLQAQTKAAQEAAQAAQTELRKARAETAISREALKHGIDMTLLTKLVDVEFDDNGMPTNVDAAVQTVLKSFPQLKAQPLAQPGATNPGRQPPKLTLADIKKMSVDQIIARQAEVDAVMSGQQ
jgi:multidrug efflux pump subunit AcrA (membrane-fusion protein)